MHRFCGVLSVALACLAGCTGTSASAPGGSGPADAGLWQVYRDVLVHAKYVDLTHTITPSIPVWPGFGHPTFGPTVDPRTGAPYTWAKDGFEATRYVLRNGYTQAERVANLDQVPEAGALVAMGFPKFAGGTGGYARFIAICPPDWKYGVSVGQLGG
jgi:hypothetical protein